MKAITVVKALGPIDARSVGRDSLLPWMVGLPIYLTLVLRWGVPWVTEIVSERLDFDLIPYYPMFAGYILIMIPAIFGMIIGFLMLDERDDHTLTALQVTPLSMNDYFIYRISLPLVLSVISTLICFPFIGLAQAPFLPLVLACVSASLIGPIIALFLASFASNKVVGFALMKSMGGILVIPLAAYLFGDPWQLFFGILPTYWPIKVFWLAHEGAPYWHYFLIGVLYNLMLLWLLLKRFNRVMYR